MRHSVDVKRLPFEGDTPSVGGHMFRAIRLHPERGASAVEYALLVAGVAALLIVIAVSLTNFLGTLTEKSCENTAKQNGFTQSEVDNNTAGCHQ
jgi:Flp pilus assembly pilin Flp